MADEHNYDDLKSADGSAGIGDNILKQLSSLAMDQKRAEAEVERLTEELKAATEKLKGYAEREIPDLMHANGMKEFTTADGIKIKVVEKVHGSIPKGNENDAFAWLKEHNHDDLIKRQFTIQFPKDEEKWAEKFERDLAKRKRPLAVEVKRSIHPSTLSSFVKGQLEEGVDFPMGIFGVFQKRTSIIEV